MDFFYAIMKIYTSLLSFVNNKNNNQVIPACGIIDAYYLLTILLYYFLMVCEHFCLIQHLN